MELEDYDSVQRWLHRLRTQRSRLSVANYVWSLGQYCNWAQVTPDDLIAERRREIELPSAEKAESAQARLLRFQREYKLKTKTTVALIVEAVQSFYRGNNAVLGETPPSPTVGRGWRTTPAKDTATA